MARRVLLGFLVAALGLVPAAAGAYSFGSFSSGQLIQSITLGPGAPTPPTVKFSTGSDPNNPSDDVLMIEAYVSTITIAGGPTISIPAGDVLFTSTVSILGSPNFGVPPYSVNGQGVSANFVNGLAADFTIVDLAGGSVVLLEAEYETSLAWTARRGAIASLLTGTISGNFNVTGGDANFLGAAVNLYKLNALLSSFANNPSGTAITSMCGLVNVCTTAGVSDFKSWQSNPNITLAVPEPAGAALLGIGLAALAHRRRRLA